MPSMPWISPATPSRSSATRPPAARSAPLALATDGTVVVAVTNGVVTLDPKTLAVRHSYSDPAKTMVTGPLVFRQNDKDMVAVGTKDGQILLLDANTMAVSSATPAFTTAGATFAGEALSFWQEYSPGRWIRQQPLLRRRRPSVAAAVGLRRCR